MNRYALYHCGLDCKGHRHWRRKTTTAMRHCKQQASLFPKIVLATSVTTGRAVWRNGLHQRRWHAVAAQVRTDRRCFLTTLPRPALVSPIPPMFG